MAARHIGPLALGARVNMPGAGDGIAAESLVPALLVAAGGAYALVMAFIGVVVAVRREMSDHTTRRA